MEQIISYLPAESTETFKGMFVKSRKHVKAILCARDTRTRCSATKSGDIHQVPELTWTKLGTRAVCPDTRGLQRRENATATNLDRCLMTPEASGEDMSRFGVMRWALWCFSTHSQILP